MGIKCGWEKTRVMKIPKVRTCRRLPQIPDDLARMMSSRGFISQESVPTLNDSSPELLTDPKS